MEPKSYHIAADFRRPERERRTSKYMGDAPLHHLGSLHDWFDGIASIQGLDFTDKDKAAEVHPACSDSKT